MRTLLLSMVGVALLTGCETARVPASHSLEDPSRFRYTRVYCTPDNETHFAEAGVEFTKVSFAPPAAPIYISGSQPASSVFFARLEPRAGADDLAKHLNHPAPALLFVAVLAGSFSITTTDGETRRFHVGDVIRAEDVAPCKGHITVDDGSGFVMFAR
jgi:hypothetical protein